MSRYVDLKPVKGEDVYIEWDEEFHYFGIFGAESGFCYGQCPSQEDAEKTAKRKGLAYL